MNCTKEDQLNIKFANLKFSKIENEPVFLIFTVRLVIGRRDYFLVFQNDRSLVSQDVLFGVLEWAVSPYYHISGLPEYNHRGYPLSHAQADHAARQAHEVRGNSSENLGKRRETMGLGLMIRPQSFAVKGHDLVAIYCNFGH